MKKINLNPINNSFLRNLVYYYLDDNLRLHLSSRWSKDDKFSLLNQIQDSFIEMNLIINNNLK